jgi:DNA-binding HxlR family transcriptional regulator
MSPVNSSDTPADENVSEAALFEAISHDTRIRTLFLLRNGALGFSELKKELGIRSSGNVQHHLGKLESLVCLNGEGLYSLTDRGKEAIMAIGAVRRTQNRERSDRIIIALIFAFSDYIAFMNVPFLLGSVNAQTPLLALWMAGFMGIFMYIVWPLNYRRSQKKSMSDFSEKDEKGSVSEASLFESIAHETRIKALFILQNGSLGFSELKKKLSLASSGNLQHHINKLGTLIEQNSDGLYSLTDNGREAIMAIQSIRGMQDRLKATVNASVIFGTLFFYAVQLTVPFLLGTVDSLTPLNALVSSVAFGICFYVIWSAAFKVIMDKKSESATWLKKEKSILLKDIESSNKRSQLHGPDSVP